MTDYRSDDDKPMHRWFWRTQIQPAIADHPDPQSEEALMPTVIDVMRAYGIKRPEITLAACQKAGLELGCGCVMLIGESAGGIMEWGSDGAPGAARSDAQGVIYQFGGPVTQANYLRFRAAQRAGRIPRQGVGDAQLTSEEFVARAEQLGGPTGPCDPYTNQLSGFIGLANRIRQFGTRNGFRAYNGSGPRAEAYADRSMAQLAVWRSRLAGAIVPQGGYVILPTLRPGDGAKGTPHGVLHWAVVSAQTLLNIRGLPVPQLVVDGVYGPATVDAVKALQRRWGLPQTGELDDTTWPWAIYNDAPDFVTS